MKRKPRSYKAVPMPVETPSGQLAREMGLPWRQVGMPRLLLGRQEWIALPDLGIGPLKARTDTGARSSCLHAEDITLSEDGTHVSFTTRDHYGRRISSTARVLRRGRVKSSTGVSRKRYFIETTALLPGGFTWTIHLTLANRNDMRFPMLIGRQAMSGFFLIDPQGSHLMGSLSDLEAHHPPCRNA
jgi:hypothetical protein